MTNFPPRSRPVDDGVDERLDLFARALAVRDEVGHFERVDESHQRVEKKRAGT